jgi:integrase
VSVYDRWHTANPRTGPDGKPVSKCREHKQYPSTDHGKGDRWQVRWRDDAGNQCKRNFPKKAGTNPDVSADAFDAQRRADQARGEWIDPRLGRTPFRDYAPVWMKSRLHRPGTTDTYERHLRNHINPAFGGMGLAAIRPTTVQQWVKDLQATKGLAPATIETIYVIFASTMRGAVRDGYVRKTPCVDIRMPEIAKTVVRLLTPGQVLALVAAMPKRYGLLVLLGAAAGLRQGEAFGLVLDRVNATMGMITVNQQVVVIDSRPVLAAPKTSASVRDVPMPAFLVDAIADHAERLSLSPDDVLCRTERGTLLRHDYYNKRIWKPAIKTVGLPADTTFHDLRHTFASTALASGVPISEVSRWLGHRSITTTVDLYGHLVPEASGRARDALDNAFKAALDVPLMCPENRA